MAKVALGNVVWHASLAGYSIMRQTDQGSGIMIVDDESTEWHEWLERVSSFAFLGKDGLHLTVSKECRGQGRSYWTAYRSVGGKLKRKYLGVSTRVTFARLEHASAALIRSVQTTTAAHLALWHDSFVITKFFVPISSHILISRSRLTDLLNQGMTRKLTLISAPAGFGKTTLVSDWVRSLSGDPGQILWVSLDRRDNEPLRFWSAILTALERCIPGHFHQLLTLLHSSPASSLEYVIMQLVNCLSRVSIYWLIIIDDYHVISEPTIHTQLSYLMECQPPHVSLFLLSRSDPPITLSRLRARGQILDVREEQLRCTKEETGAFLTEVMGVKLPDAVLQELTTRTEGWFVGLRFAGLMLQRGVDSAVVLEELRGSQRNILDYFVEEVLQHQDPHMQTFLLCTSVLKQFCAPLCDAVVGESGSQQKIVELDRTNVFVLSLDEHRQWYRYHPLFAEALYCQLEQQYAEKLDVLQVRASKWYAEQGNHIEAVRHALLGHAWHQAADLIEQISCWLIWNDGQSRAEMLRQWLQSLPEEVIYARANLCLMYAQALYFWAPYAMVEFWLQAAEAALIGSRPQTINISAPCEESKNLLGKIAGFRAVLAAYQSGDVQASVAFCQQALAQLSPQNHSVQADTLLVQACAHFANGEMGAALKSAMEAEQLAQSARNISGAIFSLCVVARCFIVKGHLHKAWRALERALQLGNRLKEDPLLRIDQVYVLQAEILREWNLLDEAFVLATQALERAEQQGTPVALIVASATSLRVALSRGHLEEARPILEQIEVVKRRRDSQQLFSFVSSFHTSASQMQYWLAQGEMAQALHWANNRPDYERSSAAIGQEREEIALVRLLLAQNQPREAYIRIEPLLECARRQERIGHVIELLLLQAQAHALLQQEQEALIQLSNALQLAEPEGYIRLFVDEGTLMKALLKHLRDQGRKRRSTPYLDTLLAAFSSHIKEERSLASPEKPDELLSPLSVREQEVLQKLSHGASNREIADALVITVETVKHHISQIIGKMQVKNRTQAVVRAYTLRLLTSEAL